MDIEKMEKKLFELSESERWHLEHPGVLSKKYENLKQKIINDEKVYVFTYKSVLDDSNFFLRKCSRFTVIPKHIHSVIEINYVYRGKCVQRINGKTVILNEKDFIILDTNTVHEVLSLSEEDIVINLEMTKQYFSSSFLSRLPATGSLSQFLIRAVFSDSNLGQYMIFRNSTENSLHDLMQHLIDEYTEKKMCRKEILDSLMIILFSELLRSVSVNQKKIESADNKLIDILRYIEENYQKPSLKEAAYKFGFNPDYLSFYLKKKTGYSFTQLILVRRMSKAGKLLVSSNEAVYKIARYVGYENLNYFYKKFLEYYGTTPSEYRNSNSNKNKEITF